MKNKIVCMRGVQGCGKSTYVETVKVRGDAVVSTDYFYMEDGVYRFFASKLSDAHGWCFKQAIKVVQAWSLAHGEEDHVLFIDNTNISSYELAPYILLSQAYSFDHEIVTIEMDPYKAADRNVHGVPLESVIGASLRMQKTELPAWWNHRVIQAQGV